MTAPHRQRELAVIAAAREVVANAKTRDDLASRLLWTVMVDIDPMRALHDALNELDALRPIEAPRAARSATVTSQNAAKWAEQWPTIAHVFHAIFYVSKTVDEIEQALQLTHQTASARVHDLANGGWIKDSGKTRLTRSGRAAVVWEATAAAREAWIEARGWRR